MKIFIPLSHLDDTPALAEDTVRGAGDGGGVAGHGGAVARAGRGHGRQIRLRRRIVR